MGFHCYHDEPCPACGAAFVRFAAEEACPRCGSGEARVYPLVEEILHYARLTLASQGDLEMRAFQPSTPADRYVVLGFDLLEAYRRLGDLEPEAVASEAVDHYQLGPGEAEREHWLRFFSSLLDGWRAERHKPLDPLPSNSAGPGPALAVSVGVTRPIESQSFRKKWSPKA